MANEKLVLTKRFINGLQRETKRRYLKQFKLRKPIEENNPLDYDSVMAILDGDGMEEVKEKVVEDWGQIRGIAKANMGEKIYELARLMNVEIEDNKPLEEIILEIMLDHKAIFQELADYFAVINRNTIKRYRMEGDIKGGIKEAKKRFRAEAIQHFSESGRGPELDVKSYDYPGEIAIIVAHGSYLKNEEYWERDGKRENRIVKPVRVDVLRYEKATHTLNIGAQSRRDQGFYFEIFANIWMEEEVTGDDDEKYQEHTLEPLKIGTFSYDGDEQIESIGLRMIEFVVNSGSQPYAVTIESKNTLESLEDMGIDEKFLNSDIISAKFQFKIRDDDRLKSVTFFLKPPYSTDLLKKKYAAVIENYLKKNGVKRN